VPGLIFWSRWNVTNARMVTADASSSGTSLSAATSQRWNARAAFA